MTNFIKQMAEKKPEVTNADLWQLIRFFLAMIKNPMPDKKQILHHLTLDSMQILSSYSFGSSKELNDGLDEIEVTRVDAQIATAFVCASSMVQLSIENEDTSLDSAIEEDPLSEDWPFKEEHL